MGTPSRRIEIKLQPPPFVSTHYVGFGLYGRIAFLRDDSSRVFKFCEPDNPAAVQSIEEEKKILEILGAHPSIIEVHWTSERGLCFEYYPLGSLRSYYKSIFPSLPESIIRIRWCHQVVEGVAFIHSKGIVNNDIGARNILISSSMDIKICDFGFATKVGEEVLCVPEIRYARNHLPSSHACFADDLFSVGSLFYEILTGAQPFQDIESTEVHKRFESLQFPPLGCIQPEYFAEVISNCWNAKYIVVGELQVDLEESKVDDLAPQNGAIEFIR
jgi:serine/threonine protein kinase